MSDCAICNVEPSQGTRAPRSNHAHFLIRITSHSFNLNHLSPPPASQTHPANAHLTFNFPFVRQPNPTHFPPPQPIPGIPTPNVLISSQEGLRGLGFYQYQAASIQNRSPGPKINWRSYRCMVMLRHVPLPNSTIFCQGPTTFSRSRIRPLNFAVLASNCSQTHHQR